MPYTVPFSPPLVVPDSECVRQHPNWSVSGSDSTFNGYICDSMDPVGTFTELGGIFANMNLAYAPQGDFVLIPLNVIADTVVHGGFFNCAADSTTRFPTLCRVRSTDRSTSAYYQVLRGTLASESWDFINVTPGSTQRLSLSADWVSISEHGDEATMQIGDIVYRNMGQLYASCSSTTTDFTALPGNSVAAGTILRSEALDPTRFCSAVFDGSSTISANRKRQPIPLSRRP